MRTGISALQHIRETLLASPKFREIADNRAYYVAAVMGTARPYVTMARTATQSTYAKDGWQSDSVIATLEIVADTYDTATRLAEVVRAELDGVTKSYRDFSVNDCEMTRSVDGYSVEVDAFVVTLDFTLEIS